nr:hypothetical protein [Tanacetum cinerariifolium]
ERGFLSSKGSGRGRGVKEKVGGSIDVSAKVNNGADEGTTTLSNVATNTQGSDNDTTKVTSVMPSDAHGPIMVDENVRQKLSNSIDNPNKESIRAISEWFANTAYGFFLGKRVACPVKEDVGNVPVGVKLYGVPVTAFSEDGLSAIATKIGTPLMLDSYTFEMYIQSWGRTSYARSLIEVRADAELKDNIVVAMPKLVREGFYTCNVRVEYEWKPPRCTCCKVFGHVQDECPKNKVSDVVKNIKKPSQTPRGVSVGLKVGFQPTKKVYRHVSKKNNVYTSGNKKKDAEPTKENAESSSPSTTPIVEKIDKIERLIIDGTVTFVDDEGIPLIMIDSSGDHDSDHEVALVDNGMANFLASKDVGYDTSSLLEQ